MPLQTGLSHTAALGRAEPVQAAQPCPCRARASRQARCLLPRAQWWSPMQPGPARALPVLPHGLACLHPASAACTLPALPVPRCCPRCCTACPAGVARTTLLPVPCLWHGLPWPCCAPLPPQRLQGSPPQLLLPHTPWFCTAPLQPALTESSRGSTSQVPAPAADILTDTELGLYTIPCTPSQLGLVGTAHLATWPSSPYLCIPFPSPTAPPQPPMCPLALAPILSHTWDSGNLLPKGQPLQASPEYKQDIPFSYTLTKAAPQAVQRVPSHLASFAYQTYSRHTPHPTYTPLFPNIATHSWSVHTPVYPEARTPEVHIIHLLQTGEGVERQQGSVIGPLAEGSLKTQGYVVPSQHATF